MDIINSPSMEIATLAMDGLAARHKAIASNIANANTPDYKRTDVVFEDQLERIIFTQGQAEDKKLKESAKQMGGIAGMVLNQNQAGGAPMNVNQNMATMQLSEFSPQVVESKINPEDEKGNTVNIEQEMSMLTKNGMTYNALATLQSKYYRAISEVIKAQ